MSAARRAFVDLPAADTARGDVRVPGSKSISIRALLLAALADGSTTVEGLLAADDTAVMIDALRALGVPVDAPDGALVEVFEVLGVGVGAPEPGRTTIRTMMSTTASSPRPSTSRRRQYTFAGWGPTGLRNVDMTQG